MNPSVLVVDDSLTVRMNLLEMLEAAGLPVVACATGAEARKAWSETPFALVILDILLPDTDGISLLKEIRETPNNKDAAVMLMSTEAEVRDRIRGLQTGADEYIGKPYEPNYVVARARELVGRKQIGPVGETVLVIDDSLTFREALKEALEGANYRVVTAKTGEEGLGLAAHVRPAALVVDGVLPGVDGATVIRRIRFDAALRRTPCLLLTASADQDAEVRALEAGADAFVRKSDDIAVILAKFKAMLRSAGGQSGDQDTASLLSPKKILAVDDSETYLQALAEALRSDSYDVVLSRSGEEALELVAVQPVDCILLDLMMPGIGGFETCRRLKAIPIMRDIPVVLLTAIEDRETMIEGLSAGADDFISKSNDFTVLHARVMAQLRRKQFEDENRLIREQILQTELEASEARAAMHLAHLRREVAAREQELKVTQTQAKLGLAMEAAKMGEVTFSAATDEVVHSPGFAALLGYPSDRRLSLDDIRQRHLLEDRDDVLAHRMAAAAESNGFYEIEHQILWPDGQVRWLAARGEIARDADGATTEITSIYMDVTHRKLAEERQHLLLQELNHRVKNTLATVQSLARQTHRNSETMGDFSETFEGRLDALSSAHDLLSVNTWEGATLVDVVRRMLAVYAADDDRQTARVSVAGPRVQLGPNAAVTLSMAFYELATNAAKYGALSGEEGQVDVGWTIDKLVTPAILEIVWNESGGPRVEPPRRRGLGSRLIEQSLVRQLDGDATLSFDPGGVRCRIRLPASANVLPS